MARPGPDSPVRPVWGRPSMNWRCAGTNTITTGIAVSDAVARQA